MISCDTFLTVPIIKRWGFLLITQHFPACFYSRTICLQEILSCPSSSQGLTTVCTGSLGLFHSHTAIYIISCVCLFFFFFFPSFHLNSTCYYVNYIERHMERVFQQLRIPDCSFLFCHRFNLQILSAPLSLDFYCIKDPEPSVLPSTFASWVLFSLFPQV